jgi:SAM-dependent methyltransferase
MSQLDWWKGEGGDAYTKRNRVEWEKRLPFWSSIVADLRPESVLEVGCNAGWNLQAIQEASGHNPLLAGIEPNDAARAEAQAKGFSVTQSWGRWKDEFDLVFTAGVLIHVPPAGLEVTMRSIIQASRRHVVCIEYADDVVMEVKYRGEWELLWRRPYGEMYEKLGLKILGEAYLPPESGFDNCTYWLLEKPASS